jgi:putative ABC transport system permease protein
MGALRRFVQRLVQTLQPLRANDEVRRELDAHAALLEDEYRRRGLSPDEAHRAARLALGGAEQVTLRHRDARVFRWMDELRVDVRYAVRRLRHRASSTVLAVAMLAVAVGLTTAMFTLVDKLLLRPLPFPHADRLTQLVMFDEHGGRVTVEPAVLRAWRDSPLIDRAEGMTTATVTLDTDAGPEAYAGATVSPGLFELLGTAPIRGHVPGGAAEMSDAVLLSETVWHAAFHDDPGIVGRRLTLDGRRVVVAGVLPASFRFPEWNTAAWRVADFGAAGSHTPAEAVVRFRAGVPESDVLKAATDAAHAVDPSTVGRRATREPLAGWASDTYYQRAVPFLAGAVVLVALVLCTNVGTLLLTRLHARRREFGMCAALGASRGRLLRQALVESVVLGGAGAAAGLGLAWGLVAVAGAVLPQPFLAHTLNPLGLDKGSLAAAAAAGFAATLISALLPAYLGTRVDARSDDRPAERTHTASRHVRLAVRGLLAGQVALACTLLVGAVLLTRTFSNLSQIDRGFDPTGVVTLWVTFDQHAFPTVRARGRAADTVEQTIRALPGVRQSAWSLGAPLQAGQIFFSDWTTDAPGAVPVRADAEAFAVSPDYFALYGIQLLTGRPFRPGDTNAAIIGERLASTLWPHEDPVGRRFTGEGLHFEVIGVAKETRRSVIDPTQDRSDMYWPFTGPRSNSSLSLRCAGTCPSEGVIRARAQTVPGVQIYRMTRLDEAFAQDLEQPRASALLAGTFALVALLASAGGLFGVLTDAVQQRRREFGIRASLGATPRAIAAVVFRDGLVVGGFGLAAGALLARTLATTIASLEYDVTGADPASWLVVAGVLSCAIALALWAPARAAARTDPARLLRED